MRARYYNPEIKRFINQDVLMGDISDGRSLNRYAYAGGNPVTMVDPFGLSPEFSPSSIVGNMFAMLGTIFSGGGSSGTRSSGDGFFGRLYSKITNVPVIGTGIKWGARGFNAAANWVGELSPASKIIIGGLAIVGLGVASVLTGGTAAVILGVAFKGALVGGALGTAIGGISAYRSGGDVVEAMADGFLWGTAGGAAGGGIGASKLGFGAKLVANVAVDTAMTAAQMGSEVTSRDLLGSAIFSAVSFGVFESGNNNKSRNLLGFADSTGSHSNVGGHHVHAQAAFRDHVSYSGRQGFAISQDYMKARGWIHLDMTNKQRELFKELARSGRPNTIFEHNRIGVEALMAGGASRQEARDLVAQSVWNLRKQGVRFPTNIPWNN